MAISEPMHGLLLIYDPVDGQWLCACTAWRPELIARLLGARYQKLIRDAVTLVHRATNFTTNIMNQMYEATVSRVATTVENDYAIRLHVKSAAARGETVKSIVPKGATRGQEQQQQQQQQLQAGWNMYKPFLVLLFSVHPLRNHPPHNNIITHQHNNIIPHQDNNNNNIIKWSKHAPPSPSCTNPIITN